MSRCAHFIPLVKLPRKAPAVMAPPSRPPTLARSAKLLRSCSAYSSVSGSCQPRVAGARTSGDQFLRERIVVAHDAGEVVAQRNHAGAGEGGDVHDGCRVVAARVVQRIAENEPAFRIRIQDLDGLAGGAGDDVARLGGATAGHVFNSGNQAHHVDAQLEQGRHQHAGQHAAGAAHVVLHLVHRGRILEGNAAGVEGDALAHQHDGGRIARTTAMFQRDEARWLGTAARYRQQAAHFQATDLRFVEYPHLEIAVASGQFLCLLRQIAWRADIAWQVAEVAQQRLAGGNGISLRESAKHGRMRSSRKSRDTHALQRGTGWFARRLQIVDAIQRGAGEIGNGATHVVIAHRAGFRLSDRERQMRGACPEARGKCDADGLAPAALGEVGRLAQAYHEHPPCLDAGQIQQQLRFTWTQRQVAGSLEFAQCPAGRRIDSLGGASQCGFVEHADGEAVGSEGGDVSGWGIESDHDLGRLRGHPVICAMG